MATDQTTKSPASKMALAKSPPLLPLPTEIRHMVFEYLIPPGPIRARRHNWGKYTTVRNLLKVNRATNADMRKLLCETQSRIIEVDVNKCWIFVGNTLFMNHPPRREKKSPDVFELRRGSLAQFKFARIIIDLDGWNGLGDDDWHLPLLEMPCEQLWHLAGRDRGGDEGDILSSVTICLKMSTMLDTLEDYLRIAGLLVRSCSWLDPQGLRMNWEYKITFFKRYRYESPDSDEDEGPCPIVTWTDPQRLSYTGGALTRQEQEGIAAAIDRFLPSAIISAKAPLHLIRIFTGLWPSFDKLRQLVLLLEPYDEVLGNKYRRAWSYPHNGYACRIIEEATRAVFNRDGKYLAQLLGALRGVAQRFFETYPKEMAKLDMKEYHQCVTNEGTEIQGAIQAGSADEGPESSDEEETDEVQGEGKCEYEIKVDEFIFEDHDIALPEQGSFAMFWEAFRKKFQEELEEAFPGYRQANLCWPQLEKPPKFRKKNAKVTDEVW